MRSASAFVSVPLACLLGLAAGGCAFSPTAAPPSREPGLAIQGNVHGGQQPIAGAHVYLFAANTMGYAGPGIAASTGNASVSLLNETYTGYSDAVGAYVLTNANGNFTFPANSYSCTPNTQVYLSSVGGDPGGGTNSAAGLMAALGNCPGTGNFATSVPFIAVNEVSTVAAAYALAGFATDSRHVASSATAMAQTGIANAFANAANLASISSGAALATTPAGNGTVPQGEINTLANILAACVNSDGAISGPTNPTACYTLFNSATSDGTPSGTQPADTASAAVNIAHNPAANLDALYRLPPPASPFAPTLSSEPNDFTVGVKFTGGGIAAPAEIAIDGSGNAWITNYSNPSTNIPATAGAYRPRDNPEPAGNCVTELSNLGAAISPASGYTSGGIGQPTGIAIDPSGNAWITSVTGSNTIAELSSAGAAISPSGGITGGGLDEADGIAIDGSGDAWTASYANSSVAEFSPSGSILSGSSGYTGGGVSKPFFIALDASGDAWVPSSGGNSVTEFSPSGTILSGSAGFSSGSLDQPVGIAIDHAGAVWIASLEGNSLTKLDASGTSLSGAGGFTGGGLNYPIEIAIDGAGNAWVANAGFQVLGNVGEFSNSGVPISPAGGYSPVLSVPEFIAVDGSGDVWVPNNGGGNVIELIGAATPVVTPISVGVANNALGARP